MWWKNFVGFSVIISTFSYYKNNSTLPAIGNDVKQICGHEYIFRMNETYDL